MRWTGMGLIIALAMLTGVANAGQVSARISGGSLYVYGDRGDNGVILESTAAGQITVTGVAGQSGESTTINGSSTPVTLSGWTNGIFVYLYEGNDSVSLVAGDVRGPTHFDLGDGADDVIVGSPSETVEGLLSVLVEPPVNASVTLQQTLFVLGGRGGDNVTVANTYVRGRATFDLGTENDELFLGNPMSTDPTSFGDYVVVVPGPGQDGVMLNQVSVAKDLTIDDPTDALTAGLFDCQIGQNLFIFGSLASDSVTLSDVSVVNLCKFILKDSNDNASLTNVTADKLEFYLGSGNDSFTGTGLTLVRMWAYLEAGNDTFNLSGSRSNYSYIYGANGDDDMTLSSCTGIEANIYGEAGTDTLRTPGNGIQTVRVYTVENRL